MNVFISDKNTAKLYIQFFRPNNPKSKYYCRNELIYLRDFEAVQKACSHVLSGVKTLSFTLSF